MTLSLCMIAKNEENHLEQCLNSVKNFVDEIVVVDTGSIDRTKEIAEKSGAKVFDDWRTVQMDENAINEFLKR